LRNFEGLHVHGILFSGAKKPKDGDAEGQGCLGSSEIAIIDLVWD
jgi:hypothetical protein